MHVLLNNFTSVCLFVLKIMLKCSSKPREYFDISYVVLMLKEKEKKNDVFLAEVKMTGGKVLVYYKCQYGMREAALK